MDWLLEEVAETISKYLSVSDLVSCCAVSVHWRDMFGQDRLWRSHCDPALASHLATTEPIVEPYFVSPETELSTLTPISKWRLEFMKEMHLHNNWNQGNFKLEEMANDCYDNNTVKMFYQNNYVLEFLQGKVVVWDVKKQPQYHSDFAIFTHPHIRVEPYHLGTSEKVVVVQRGVVQVLKLDIEAKELPKVEVFAVGELEKCLDNGDKVLRSLFEKQDNSIYPSCIVIGNMLVGNISVDRKPLNLHVWNLETIQKLKKEPCPFHIEFDYYTNVMFEPCDKTNDVLLTYIFEVQNEGHRHYYVYSLNQLAFLPFLKKFSVTEPDYYKLYNYQCAIFAEYVVIYEDSLFIYNYHTSELLHTFCPSSGYCILKSNVLFFEDNVLQSVDPSTKVVNQFNIVSSFPRAIADRAFYKYHDNEEGDLQVKFTNATEAMKCDNKNAMVFPMYSFPVLNQAKYPPVVNKAASKILLEGLGMIVIVNLW